VIGTFIDETTMMRKRSGCLGVARFVPPVDPGHARVGRVAQDDVQCFEFGFVRFKATEDDQLLAEPVVLVRHVGGDVVRHEPH
jgi:hypothetical protein